MYVVYIIEQARAMSDVHVSIVDVVVPTFSHSGVWGITFRRFQPDCSMAFKLSDSCKWLVAGYCKGTKFQGQ